MEQYTYNNNQQPTNTPMNKIFPVNIIIFLIYSALGFVTDGGTVLIYIGHMLILFLIGFISFFINLKRKGKKDPTKYYFLTGIVIGLLGFGTCFYFLTNGNLF